METSRANADPSGRILLGLFVPISAELRCYVRHATACRPVGISKCGSLKRSSLYHAYEDA